MKYRSDFVSNSSSSSFILLEKENYGIFRDNVTTFNWNDYCEWYLCHDVTNNFQWYRYDYFDYGYSNEQDGDYTQVREPSFKCKLVDLIDYTFTDKQFVEKWLTSTENEMLYWFPPSCEELVEKIIPIKQKIDENDYINRKKYINDAEGLKKFQEEQKVLSKCYWDLMGELVSQYKEVLTPYCKDLIFVRTSCSDHDSGWCGEDDAESAMIFTMRNSKAKFQRIISEH